MASFVLPNTLIAPRGRAPQPILPKACPQLLTPRIPKRVPRAAAANSEIRYGQPMLDNPMTRLPDVPSTAAPKYRRAVLEDVGVLSQMSDGKNLMRTTIEELECWIKCGELFVATKHDGVQENVIGMIRLSFLHSHEKREKIIQMLGLSKPSEVVRAGRFCDRSAGYTQDNSLVGKYLHMDLQESLLFYTGSFYVIDTERNRLTAFRLCQYALSQYARLFESIRGQLRYSQETAAAFSKGRARIGLLFGSSPEDNTVYGMAIRLWLGLTRSFWGTLSVNINSLAVEHIRPDGVTSNGNVVFFDVPVPDKSGTELDHGIFLSRL